MWLVPNLQIQILSSLLTEFEFIQKVTMAFPGLSRWENRVALVTGASSGIGASICKNFVKHGLIVIGCARRKERIDVSL